MSSSIFETNENTSKLTRPLHGVYSTDRIVVAKSGNENSILIFNRPVDNAQPSYAASHELIHRFPDRKRLQFGTYEIGLDYAAKILEACWPERQLIFQNNTVRLQYLSALARDRLYDKCAERVAIWRKYKEIAMPQAYEIHPKKPLNSYQQVVLHNAMETNYLFFGDMGTGKTPTSIAVICNDLLRKQQEEPTKRHLSLVICPNQVKLNWSEELDRFTTVGLHAQIIDGYALKRVRQLYDGLAAANEKNQGYVAIIGWSSLAATLEALKFWKFDILIADELHYAKTPKTQRWRALEQLAAAKRLGLTGDPISNTIFDLYTQLEFLNKGGSGFASFEAFKNFYGVYDRGFNQEGHAKLVALQNVPFIQEQLARKSFIISKKEALPDLPKMVTSVRGIEMSEEQSKVYKQVAVQMLAEIEDDIARAEAKGTPSTVTANNILTKMLRLAQIAAGFFKTDNTLSESGAVLEKGVIRYFKKNPKIDELLSILKARGPETKTIIWACFVPAIRQISEVLTIEGFGHATYYGQVSKPQRESEVKQFNSNPDCTVFLANQACAGEGLNLLGYEPHAELQSNMNASQTIFYCQNFSKTQRTQPEARNHRFGTRVQVDIIDLVTMASIDVEIRERVVRKRMMAYEISDVKVMLSRLAEDLR